MANDSSSLRAPRRSLIGRLHYALGPLLGGLILDAADLVTFGPLGLYTGPVIGLLAGWWVASIYGFTWPVRLVWAALAAAYCTAPMTSMLPVATTISACARFWDAPATPPAPPAATGDPGGEAAYHPPDEEHS